MIFLLTIARNMRLGFDGRWLFRGPISGKNCAMGLLQGIIESGFNPNNLYVFTNNYLENASFHTIVSKKTFGLYFNGIVIPTKANALNLDWTIYQFIAPNILSKKHKTALIVHDLIFKSHPEYFTYLERFYFKLIKNSCKHADLIFSISNYTKQKIIDYGYADGTKVKVVYAGFIPIEINRKTKVYLNLPDNYILYVGRLNNRKNIYRLIQAFNQIKDSIDYELVIVGKPDWKFDDFRPKLSNIQKRKIHFLGYLSNSELDYVYRKAKLFIYIPIEEGFGLPILEAMHYGIPCITSKSSSLPEVGGDAVEYTDPYNIEKIALTIEKVLINKLLMKEMIKKGFKQSKKFSWKKTATKIINYMLEY